MKRTLVAVGIAVLLSMLLVPRGYVYIARYHRTEGDIRQLLPFFVHSPYGWEVLWQAFIMQTIFLAVLAAVIVNVRWRRQRN
jgi:hypothetical protein